LGLEVHICNAGAYLGAQNLNVINQFLALSKKKAGATLGYLPLEMTTNVDEYGFVLNSLAQNCSSSTGRSEQAMGIKTAGDERYQFKCGSTERYLMQRGTFYFGVSGSLQLVPGTYQVIIVLFSTLTGDALDAKKWDKINYFNDEINITIPCTVFD